MSSQLNRRPWTKEEDDIIKQLVDKLGVKNWSMIAYQLTEHFMMQPRTGKQCRERWHNHLDPKVDKKSWSQEEEKILEHYQTILGNKWSEISKMLPGRTDNSIKNHYYSNQRKNLRLQSKQKSKKHKKHNQKKLNQKKEKQQKAQSQEEMQPSSQETQTKVESIIQKRNLEDNQEVTQNEETKNKSYKKFKPSLQLSNEINYDNLPIQGYNSNYNITPLISPQTIFQFPLTPTSMVFVSPRSSTFFTVPESPSETFKSNKNYTCDFQGFSNKRIFNF